eukprot:CAMPEP_0181178228 /NCGR_PEP_ID=MMETSP1096-20121128/5611_1 /TAXON_ID=156174 ORGANISM="Chrysochromulina ericina, Strain CCMP281" /NCGR_SAMPLE_ID=MMETSP1096 /ASSEMBLY_ACC=CAM_ASM_000453 /LENGTH=122 /DNA_ID=CAMNT_0023266489 /DNA_START=143 /DNA_END=508 /DNA_ORIENTATION=+
MASHADNELSVVQFNDLGEVGQQLSPGPNSIEPTVLGEQYGGTEGGDHRVPDTSVEKEHARWRCDAQKNQETAPKRGGQGNWPAELRVVQLRVCPIEFELPDCGHRHRQRRCKAIVAKRGFD